MSTPDEPGVRTVAKMPAAGPASPETGEGPTAGVSAGHGALSPSIPTVPGGHSDDRFTDDAPRPCCDRRPTRDTVGSPRPAADIVVAIACPSAD